MINPTSQDSTEQPINTPISMPPIPSPLYNQSLQQGYNISGNGEQTKTERIAIGVGSSLGSLAVLMIIVFFVKKYLNQLRNNPETVNNNSEESSISNAV
jgi:hypothetical protein